jgi:hypothetical protein
MDTPEFIVARRAIQERIEVRRAPNPQGSGRSSWSLWSLFKWLWPTLLAVGFKKTLPGLASRLGLGWLVPGSFSRR